MSRNPRFLLAPCLVLLSIAGVRGQDSVKTFETPSHRADAQDPDSLKKTRMERKAAIDAYRDGMRRKTNVMIGIGPTLVLFLPKAPATDSQASEALPALGLSLGYRTHFRRRFGIKAESQLYSGPTWVGLDVDGPSGGSGSTRTFSGGEGATTVLGWSGQLVLGPFGRAVLEPGLGVSQVWRSASRVELKDDAQSMPYRLKAHQAFWNTMLGVGVYLGRRDQINLTGTIKGGNEIGDSRTVTYQLQANLAYALQL